MSAARVLALFAFYAAALDLGAAIGLVGAVASPPGMALLAAAALLLAWDGFRAARAAGSPALRVARALLRGGLALALAALVASLAGRDAAGLAVTEGEELPAGALPGLPPVRFGEATLLPRGPHVLSKTVAIEAAVPGEPPVSIGLFPPASLGDRRVSIMRYGFAPGVVWRGPGGALVGEGFVKLGTLRHREEDAALVSWTPEVNVMMGAGTYPPRIEDLVTDPASGDHLFLRLEEATVAGARRDFREPDAHLWMSDGRPEDAVFLVQAFRAKEKVFEGRVRAGESVEFPGGGVAIEPEVALWVELVAARDPFLPLAGAGLALVAAGALLRAAIALAALVGRPRPG
jgi:hypothetical protein